MSRLHHHLLVFYHLVVVDLSAVAGKLRSLCWGVYHHLAWEYRSLPGADLVEDWTSMQMEYYFD